MGGTNIGMTSTGCLLLARNMWINKLKRMAKVSDLKEVDFQSLKDQPLDYVLATERMMPNLT